MMVMMKMLKKLERDDDYDEDCFKLKDNNDGVI